jgi:hypothetical protein
MSLALDGSNGMTAPSGAVYNGLQSLAPVTTNSQTTTVGSGIPSWVKRVTLVYNRLITASTGNLQWQLNGVTTGYLSSASYIAPSVNVSSSTSGLMFTLGTGSGSSPISGITTMMLLSGNTWTFTATSVDTTNTQNMWGSGYIILGSALTSVALYNPGGSMTSGTVTVYYE